METPELVKSLSATLEKHLSALITELTQVARQGGSATTGGGSNSGVLQSSYRRITGAQSQAEILRNLLEATEPFAPRAALLVVRGDRLTGWRSRGFDAETAEAVRSLNLAAEGEGGWKQAVAEQVATPNTIEAAPAAVSEELFGVVGKPADGNAYLLPLLVKGRAVAVLYADCSQTAGSLDLPALDLLAALTGMYIEISAARPKAAAAAAPAEAAQEAAAPAAEPAFEAPPAEPEPAPVVETAPVAPAAPAAPRPLTGPDLSSIPENDHEVHKKAFRFAKLLVDDLILYNKAKIEQGRAQGDIYSAVKDDIDKSRAAYEKKWGSTAAGKIDYFHQLLVARVAQDDPAILGTQYPGPLV